ncbi:MAG: hypothetical protein ACT4OG_08930 [Alphaproteobacteria bacterium]
MSHSSSSGPDSESRKRRIGRGGWLAAAILGGLFGVAVWFAFRGWMMVPGEVSPRGYAIMIVGFVFVVALGAGLMALVFWSHKKGYDR